MAKFKLTGKQVSEEMTEVIQRLEQGAYVPIEDIENTPELQLARSCVNNSVSTHRLSGREELREHVLRQLQENGSAVLDADGRIRYNGEVRKDSRLDIVIGLPASGKSSAVADVISSEFHSRIIDNDEAKKLLPEYNDGWGAGVVHEESQLISGTQLQQALMKHENIVLPKVGSDPEKIDRIIKLAKSEDYKVNVHFVDLEREKALGRMLNRFLEDGRFLDPELIDKYCNSVDGNKISKCYETLKKGGSLDGYSKWSNDVKRGERPVLIEAECTGNFIRSAGASRDFTTDIQDNGGIRDNGRYHDSGHDRQSGNMEKSDRGRGTEKSSNDIQQGTGSAGGVKQSILKKLADYKHLTDRNEQKTSVVHDKSKNAEERKNRRTVKNLEK
ncbi:MAG: zeta toxin family protein [Lachnospiraceae bacterium]|nr:zeta toxin family protein [Lachnospiraceae bacterium]